MLCLLQTTTAKPEEVTASAKKSKNKGKPKKMGKRQKVISRPPVVGGAVREKLRCHPKPGSKRQRSSRWNPLTATLYLIDEIQH